MNDLISMQFEGTAVRIVDVDGEAWFVGADVARVLGYQRPNDALQQHCKGAVKHRPLPTAGGIQECRVIPESDVLRLVVKSKLPAAERFERWVFEEVLPTIRRTGSYGTPAPAATDIHSALGDPAALRGLLLGYTEKVIQLEAKVAEQAQDVAALDQIAKAQGSFNLRTTAKLLDLRQSDLIAYLQAQGWIYRHPGNLTWTGYASRREQG
jgi:anti-repressor protein